MKKIPTLFERVFEGKRVVGITDRVLPGLEWVLEGEGYATIKTDGSCCAVIDGELYKRFDAKPGRRIPEDAIPCCDPDPITGHWPHWVKVDPENPADRWFIEARNNVSCFCWADGTYEAVGPHFNGNAHNLTTDVLIRHGEDVVTVERTFSGIRRYLERNCIEGLVFWKDGEPRCKIKRSDFGLPWGGRQKGERA